MQKVKKRPGHCLKAVQNKTTTGRHKQFNSRIIVTGNVNNGQSVNWHHDWWTYNKVSYANVVKDSVNNVKSHQVDNYPWKPTVAVYSRSDKYDTNRVFTGESARVVHTDSTKVSHSKKINVAGKGFNIKSRNVEKQPRLHKTSSKVRINNVFTGDNKTHVISSSVNIDKTNCQSLTPVTHNNRFWPLIDLDNDNEGKVVIHESKGGDRMSKNMDRKQTFLSSSSHIEANVSCNLHNDTVGGDGARIDTVTVTSHDRVNTHSPNPSAVHDKYDLALRFKNKHKVKIDNAANVEIFKQWDSQTVGKFGYIPLAAQVGNRDDKCNKVQSNLLQIHNKVKRTGTYNFLEAKIQIPSQLKVEAWKDYLVGYWDKQLIQLIKYGFPLSFDKNTELISSNINHSSAKDCPEDIAVYLKEERTFGAILGPFTKPPVANLHVSPFLTREKAGANSRRVIVDLSYPHGASVNAGVDPESYLGSEFLLTLPSIDYITNKVVQLGKGSLIYKIDISRAFRHIKIDPADYNLLGLNFNAYYLDTCLPFGFRHGSAIF